MQQERFHRALAVLAVAGPLFLMLLLAWTPGISFTEDLGRHILLGKIISEEGVVPKTNYLTYTHPEFPFVNHHWLSEVVLHQLHRIAGYNGLIVFKMLMMTGALALALFAVRGSNRPLLVWLAGILAAVMISFRSHIRPELFTFLGVGLLLFCFERMRNGQRWPWFAAVAALWIWSNAQIYFIFGLFMCTAFAAERFVLSGKSQVSSFKFRHAALWLAALLLACVANPNGLSGLLYPFHIFSDYAVGITENASVFEYARSVCNPMMLALPFATALALWSAWANRKTRPANSIIVLAACAASWLMARSVPLLAIALPVSVASVPHGPDRHVSSLQFRVSLFACAAGLAVLNVALLGSVLSGSFHRRFPSPIGPTPFGFDDENRYLAVQRLQAGGLPGNIFTDYNIGSLAEYNLWPALRGYVDNRPEAFPGAFWRTEYTPALGLGPEWEAIRARRGINTVIVSLTGVKDQYTQELMRRPEWVLVHLDALLGVWVLNAEPNRTFLQRYAFTAGRLAEFDDGIAARVRSLPALPPWRRHVEADRAVYECYALICVGATPRAWRHIWALHELYPDYQIVHELMRVSAPPERVEDVKRVMERRARWPVAAKQVLDWARVLEADGRLEEARSACRRGRFFFPLSDALRETERQLADAIYRAQSFQ